MKQRLTMQDHVNKTQFLTQSSSNTRTPKGIEPRTGLHTGAAEEGRNMERKELNDAGTRDKE
jgi:hypothetical protein